MWFEDILDLVGDEDGEDDDPCEDLCYAKANRSGSTKAIDRVQYSQQQPPVTL